MVNLAVHRLLIFGQADSYDREALGTYNIAYMILDAKTSRLPISRCWISKAVRPTVRALLVPYLKMTCTRPIRIINGIMLKAMILSSRKSFSVRMYRPDNRTNMITRAKPVHHHETSKVGLSCTAVCAGGGVE